MAVSNPYSVRIVTFASGERIPVLCLYGMPVVETTEWTLGDLFPAGDATNTMAAKIRAVGHWLRWASQTSIDWNERVASGVFLTQNEITSAKRWMRLPIGIPPGVKAGKLNTTIGTQAGRMIFVGQFLRWMADRILPTVPPVNQDRVADAFNTWQVRWRKWTPDVGESRPSGERFGLSPEQQDHFLKVIRPDAPNNPFEPGMRVRNHAILTLLFDHGLRMSEPLMLKTGDLKFGERELVIPGTRNAPGDPRKVIPSPKKGRNLQHGGGRRIRLTPKSMRALEAWMNEDRRDEGRYPGARKSPYVFVSERGLPLSVRRLGSIFETLRTAFPEFGKSFSPHILRHTFVEEYIRNHPRFTPKDRQDLCYLLGWTQTSKMPDRYGLPAIKESGGEKTRELSLRRHERALEQLETKR